MNDTANIYKNLNYPKQNLENKIKEFCDTRNLLLKKLDESTNKKEIYVLDKTGIVPARFEIYHLQDGKTTFHPRVGKNHSLSIELANYLLEDVHFCKGQLTSVLMGYSVEDIEPIIQLMLDKKHDSGLSFFEYEKNEIQGGIRFFIKNSFYQDKLIVTVYKTKKVVIQGFPLSCHDEFIFQMSALLDAGNLARVISKTDENVIQLVEQRTIEGLLVTNFEEIYKKLPQDIKNMLISGSTLRSIKVTLPDYTCLVFPDLRALEGIIKNIFFTYDIEYEKNVGELFENSGNQNYKLKAEHVGNLPNRACIIPLEKIYNFYHKHRHTLFHMEDIPNASRVITNFDAVVDLIDDIYNLIKDVYKTLP